MNDGKYCVIMSYLCIMTQFSFIEEAQKDYTAAVWYSVSVAMACTRNDHWDDKPAIIWCTSVISMASEWKSSFPAQEEEVTHVLP